MNEADAAPKHPVADDSAAIDEKMQPLETDIASRAAVINEIEKQKKITPMESAIKIKVNSQKMSKIFTTMNTPAKKPMIYIRNSETSARVFMIQCIWLR
jgi:uncharacterized protein (DUF1697 family)